MLREDGTVIEPGSGEIGTLARSGHIPLRYHNDPEKSAKTFKEFGGVRYSLPGDFARVEDDGSITMLGRGSVSINTGGEKVFPEEVEAALKAHPDVFDTVVVGVPDDRFGQRSSPSSPPGERAAVADRPERGGPQGTGRIQVPARRLVRRRDQALTRRETRLSLGRRAHRRPRRRRDTLSFHHPPDLTRGTMRTQLAEQFGIDYPIFGFTPSQHVAAAISRAGGLGVLGCVRFNEAEELDAVLEWMHENTDGKPFGVDVVMPAKIPTEGSKMDLDSMIPPEHRAFVDRTLADLGVPPLSDDVEAHTGCSAGCTRWPAPTSTSRWNTPANTGRSS